MWIGIGMKLVMVSHCDTLILDLFSVMSCVCKIVTCVGVKSPGSHVAGEDHQEVGCQCEGTVQWDRELWTLCGINCIPSCPWSWIWCYSMKISQWMFDKFLVDTEICISIFAVTISLMHVTVFSVEFPPNNTFSYYFYNGILYCIIWNKHNGLYKSRKNSLSYSSCWITPFF